MCPPRPSSRPILRLIEALGALALVLMPATASQADQVEVQLRLPVRARIDLLDRKTVTVTPFLVLSQEGEQSVERRGVNVEREFDRYLRRLIRRTVVSTIASAVNLCSPPFSNPKISQAR